MFRIWPPLISSPGPRRRNQGRPNPEHGYRERLSRFGKEAYSAWASAERRCAPRLQSPTSVILHEFVAVAVGGSLPPFSGSDLSPRGSLGDGRLAGAWRSRSSKA